MTNDQIDQFKVFIDFLQNIDKYKQVIVDLKTSTEDYNKSYAILSQGQNLTVWQTKIEADQKKATQDLLDAQASFDQQTATKTQQLADQAASLAKREADLIQSAKDVMDRGAQVAINENLVSTKLNDLTVLKQQLDAKEADLKQRELALATKATQIQQLLG